MNDVTVLLVDQAVCLSDTVHLIDKCILRSTVKLDVLRLVNGRGNEDIAGVFGVPFLDSLITYLFFIYNEAFPFTTLL